MDFEGTMPDLIYYLQTEYKIEELNEASLVAYLLIKKEYDLPEISEKDIDLDKQWFLTDIKATAPTGRYNYSVFLEDFYIGIFKIIARRVIANRGTVTMRDIPFIGWELLGLLKKVVYKIKKEEKCIYYLICQNEDGISKEDIINFFVEEKCRYSFNKHLCSKCTFKHANDDSKCGLNENIIENALKNLIDNNAIKISDNGKYKSVF